MTTPPVSEETTADISIEISTADSVRSHIPVALSPVPEFSEIPTKEVVINAGDPEKHPVTGTDENGGRRVESKGELGAYFRLWSYATPLDRLLHLCGFLAACGAGAVLPIMTIIFGNMVDVFNSLEGGFVNGVREPPSNVEDFRRKINKYSLWFVYLFIGKFILVYIHTTVFTLAGIRMTRSIRLAYIKSLLRQDIPYFDMCLPGSVATRITTNANMIQTGLSEKVGVGIQGFSMLTTAFVVAFIQNWKLTFVTATTVPVAVAGVVIAVRIDSKLESELLEIYSRAAGLAEEVLGSIRNVVAFAANEKLGKRYNEYLAAAEILGVKKGPMLGLQYSSEFFGTYCAYALCFWYGIRLMMAGEIRDGGTIVTVFFNMIFATGAVMMVAPSMADFTKAAVAAKDVLEMIDRVPAIDSPSDAEQPANLENRIEFRNVGFRYPSRPSVKVLDGVNLVFEAHKTTALVGASGSGKSTIIGLLERWYDPEEGDVFLDGQDIRGLNLKGLRGKIGLVQQEPMLFNDTIYNNVVHGLAGTLDENLPEKEEEERVKKACIEANAHEFIKALPEGYKTIVGERAGKLSGGEKQRIAIARSIISNPSILLLDEATSALDPNSEGIVQAALDRASESRTTVMIAHKLSTVKKADKIIVMNKGLIIEEGTHDSLLQKKGAYYRLVQAQNLDSAGPESESRVVNSENSSVAGGAEAETEGDVGGESSQWDLNKVETSDFTVREPLQPEDVSRKFSLVKCLAIIFKEQQQLWPWFACGFLAAFAAGAVFPVQAVLFSKIVTVFQLPREALQQKGNFWALMFFILALMTVASYAALGFFLTVAGSFVSRFYRAEYFSAMMSQDISFFDRPENSSASLTSRLSMDPQQLQDLVSGNIGLICVVLVNLISNCALALLVGWKLALVAVFGTLPPIFLAGFFRLRLDMRAHDRSAKFFLESSRFASEAVGAIRTVASLTLEDAVLRRYEERLQKSVRDGVLHTVRVMALFGLSDSIELLGMGLAFWYGGNLLADHEMRTKQFFIVFVAVIFGGQAAGIIFAFTKNFTKARSSANQIIALKSQKPPINGSTGQDLKPSDDPIAVEFRDVKFRYPTRSKVTVLRDLNLKILKGQTVGLVGPSGCGKTTVISLLERFYDPTSGTILINSKALTSLNVAQHRAKVSLVSQEPTLYQGSIRENILLGAPDDTKEEVIIKACKDANIHTFISSLPESYTTDCGSKGIALSGGQRQRIAIARALIRDPDILLLDEATSALDTESEKVVQEALVRASRGRTTIAVAHRLSTIQHADVIFVFDNGRIVEEGTHDELLRKGGKYYHM
ncbi:hypothetical protein RUND412_010070, partial [Rhizina undulata]